ncbi:hypothetical protein PMAYCL1PPCAC_13357, partial [Pristionchus mayeri]
DKDMGLYLNWIEGSGHYIPKGETISCRKLSCEEYSELTLTPGVKTDGKTISCIESPSLVETSSRAVSSPSFVCD